MADLAFAQSIDLFPQIESIYRKLPADLQRSYDTLTNDSYEECDPDNFNNRIIEFLDEAVKHFSKGSDEYKGLNNDLYCKLKRVWLHKAYTEA